MNSKAKVKALKPTPPYTTTIDIEPNKPNVTFTGGPKAYGRSCGIEIPADSSGTKGWNRRWGLM